jgi:hypothetical protein
MHIHETVRSWYVEYETEAVEGGIELPAGRYVHRVIAAKWPDRYYHWSTKGSQDYGWRNDPGQQRLTMDGPNVVNEHVWDRSFEVVPSRTGAPLPGTAPQELLWFALGWWPFERRSAPRLLDTPVVFREVAASSSYVVRPFLEQVGTHQCHVLEYPGHDRLWLDCDRYCAVMAREVMDPDSGKPWRRLEMDMHRELQPGIWVPTRMRHVEWRTDGRSGKATRIVDIGLKIVDAQVNCDLPDGLFRFQPVPGSLEISRDNHFVQRVPGGMEHLDDIASGAAAYAASVEEARPPRSESIAEYCVILLGVLAVVVPGRANVGRRPMEDIRKL